MRTSRGGPLDSRAQGRRRWGERRRGMGERAALLCARRGHGIAPPTQVVATAGRPVCLPASPMRARVTVAG